MIKYHCLVCNEVIKERDNVNLFLIYNNFVLERKDGKFCNNWTVYDSNDNPSEWSTFNQDQNKVKFLFGGDDYHHGLAVIHSSCIMEYEEEHEQVMEEPNIISPYSK